MVPVHTSFSRNWEELQDRFRTQFSKIGNKREKLFHVWRTFHIDENAEAIDIYVQSIVQVAANLNYGEPHILEVFKNTLLSHLYWVFLPVDTLREAVETTKRILTKEDLE